ncbi:hypothetical protein CIL03_18180 [Virgibacillus indicus]|uniref:Lipoprotein n=1 Tax=Virgibacillus indicus TaxID=2024554 RepID=A0A265N5J1_9BACI|nr:hypothetical protein [Virgibacillus indicus]OZU87115.1 hypothetical protein CIL03_18180 [Virgibacillus indicus]
MRGITVIIIWLAVFILVGCNEEAEDVLSGDRPPDAYIDIDNEKYPAKLGSYCWQLDGKGECVDMAGPVELLKGKEPVEVEAGETVTFGMDFHPKPNEVYVLQIENGKESELDVNGNSFRAPKKEGIYYYSYGVWWMDEKEKNVSNGDAFYFFALDVQQSEKQE